MDFIVTLDCALERIRAPLPRSDLGATSEALQGLQMHSREGDALLDVQPRGFDSARLERQLHAFLGPRSNQEDMRTTAFTFTNITAQLVVGEPLSPMS